MSSMVKMLFDGPPKPDTGTATLQRQQLNKEQQRQSGLAAEEAATKRAISSGRTGRGLLAYTPGG